MQISHLVRQSFDLFNTYGKDPGALQNITIGFCEVLNQYETNQVTTAFKIWMEDHKIMPTPSEIKKIVIGNLPQKEYEPPKGRQEKRYHDLTDIEKDDFDKNMAEARQALNVDEDDVELKRSQRDNQDYSHFNRMSADQKGNISHGMRNMVKH